MKIIKTAQYSNIDSNIEDKKFAQELINIGSGDYDNPRKFPNLLSVGKSLINGLEPNKKELEAALKEIDIIVINKIKNQDRYSNDKQPIVKLKNIQSKLLAKIFDEKPVYAKKKD